MSEEILLNFDDGAGLYLIHPHQTSSSWACKTCLTEFWSMANLGGSPCGVKLYLLL